MNLFYHAEKRQRDDMPLLFKEAARRCKSRRIRKDREAWIVQEVQDILRRSLMSLLLMSPMDCPDMKLWLLLQNHQTEAEEYAKHYLKEK